MGLAYILNKHLRPAAAWVTEDLRRAVDLGPMEGAPGTPPMDWGFTAENVARLEELVRKGIAPPEVMAEVARHEEARRAEVRKGYGDRHAQAPAGRRVSPAVAREFAATKRLLEKALGRALP